MLLRHGISESLLTWFYCSFAFLFCRLRFEAVSQTSPITLHLFLRNIFAVCDINVMEGALFCDSICSSEMFYNEQVCVA